MLTNIIAIIEKDPHVADFDKDVYGELFEEPEELSQILTDRSHYNFNNTCFRRLKEFVTKSNPSDYQKTPITRALHTYLSELYRKLNVRNTMSAQFAEIEELNSAVDSHKFSINYSE